MRNETKTKAVKLLGLLGALVAAAGLALSGQHVEAIGIFAAAFSSVSAVSPGS